LNTAITNAGGTALKEKESAYWSSSEGTPGAFAYRVYLEDGNAQWTTNSESFSRLVRACLAF